MKIYYTVDVPVRLRVQTDKGRDAALHLAESVVDSLIQLHVIEKFLAHLQDVDANAEIEVVLDSAPPPAIIAENTTFT